MDIQNSEKLERESLNLRRNVLCFQRQKLFQLVGVCFKVQQKARENNVK